MGDALSDGPELSGRHWFEPVAEHLGRAYLRYSFTKGTEQEVDFLARALGLRRGSRVLDVGCGPGRHLHAFARRGIEAVGLDISERFTRIAREDGATVVRADARRMAFRPAFDAAVSLCQGAFGLLRFPGAEEDADVRVLQAMRDALRPGGRIAVSGFNALFRVRHPGESAFDPDTGVDHEVTEVLDEDGRPKQVDLWTTCYTPRELRLIAAGAGLVPEQVWSVAPGDYAARPPDAEHPEVLLVARRR